MTAPLSHTFGHGTKGIAAGPSSGGTGRFVGGRMAPLLPPYTWAIVDAFIIDAQTLEVLWHGRTVRDETQIIEFRQRHTHADVNLLEGTLSIIPPKVVRLTTEDRTWTDFKFDRTPTIDMLGANG